MDNLLEQIARHIEFLGYGTVADQDQEGNIFYGRMPDDPDECVCVFSTDSGIGGTDKPARIQIMVRARYTKTAYELSVKIANDLDEFEGFLAGDGAHVSIEAINSANGIGADDRNRELYTSNFYIYYCNF